MSESKSNQDPAMELADACARRDDLRQALLAMNGGNPNLYAGMGRSEGYDSLLCSLRGEQAIIEELSPSRDADSKT